MTQDVDLLAELIEAMYGDHSATFLSADPARIDGGLRLASAGGLSVGLPRYGGFTYTARSEPVAEPTVMWVRSGSAALSWPGGTCAWFPAI